MRIAAARTLTWLILVLAAMPAAALESRRLTVDGAGFRVVRLDLDHERLELRWRDEGGAPLAGIEALRHQARSGGRRLLFATNAGIYDREYRPLGLHIEEGRTLRPLNTTPGAPRAGNFSIQPNGVFYVEGGRAGVMTTRDFAAAGLSPRLATQSGPMLVVDGTINPALDPDSGSLKWRSGVCAVRPREVVFAVSEVPVSFHAFARLFRDHVGCRDALYLDGTLSRIWTEADGYAGAPAFMVKPYAGMLAAFPIEPSSP